MPPAIYPLRVANLSAAAVNQSNMAESCACNIKVRWFKRDDTEGLPLELHVLPTPEAIKSAVAEALEASDDTPSSDEYRLVLSGSFEILTEAALQHLLSAGSSGASSDPLIVIHLLRTNQSDCFQDGAPQEFRPPPSHHLADTLNQDLNNLAALGELVENSIEFSKDERLLRDGEKNEIHIDLNRDAQTIVVRDNGSGMTRLQLEAFVTTGRTKRASGGSGGGSSSSSATLQKSPLLGGGSGGGSSGSGSASSSATAQPAATPKPSPKEDPWTIARGASKDPWVCGACTLENSAAQLRCTACRTPSPRRRRAKQPRRKLTPNRPKDSVPSLEYLTGKLGVYGIGKFAALFFGPSVHVNLKTHTFDAPVYSEMVMSKEGSATVSYSIFHRVI